LSVERRDFKIGVVATIHYPASHANVIVSRWLEPRSGDREWVPKGPARPRCVIGFSSFFGEKRTETNNPPTPIIVLELVDGIGRDGQGQRGDVALKQPIQASSHPIVVQAVQLVGR